MRQSVGLDHVMESMEAHVLLDEYIQECLGNMIIKMNLWERTYGIDQIQ